MSEPRPFVLGGGILDARQFLRDAANAAAEDEAVTVRLLKALGSK